MNELHEFEAKAGRWALLVMGPLWGGVGLYCLIAHPETSIGGTPLTLMGLIALIAGIHVWRHR